MQKIRFTTIMLITLYILLSILSVLMMYHITICDTISCMGSGCFGDDNIMIETDSSIKDISKALEKLSVRVALYNDEKQDDGGVIRYFYMNKYYVNFPMLEGRFFNKKDIDDSRNCAVIGKNKLDQVYKVNDKNYIRVNESEYEVLGVIGYESKTSIDDYIFVNMLSETEHEFGTFYIIDIWGGDETQDIIATELDNNNLTYEMLSVTKKFSDTILPQILYSRWFVYILICNVMCMIIVLKEWVNQQKYEVGIRRMLGADKIDILKYIMGKYLIIVSAGSLIGIIICMVFYSGYLMSLVYGYLICIPIMVIVLIKNIYQLINIQVVEGIK